MRPSEPDWLNPSLYTPMSLRTKRTVGRGSLGAASTTKSATTDPITVMVG